MCPSHLRSSKVEVKPFHFERPIGGISRDITGEKPLAQSTEVIEKFL